MAMSSQNAKFFRNLYLPLTLNRWSTVEKQNALNSLLIEKLDGKYEIHE